MTKLVSSLLVPSGRKVDLARNKFFVTHVTAIGLTSIRAIYPIPATRYPYSTTPSIHPIMMFRTDPAIYWVL